MKNNFVKFNYINAWGEKVTGYSTEAEIKRWYKTGEMFVADTLEEFIKGESWEITAHPSEAAKYIENIEIIK